MKLMMTEIKAKPSYLMEDEFKSLHADVKSTCINEVFSILKDFDSLRNR